ncbi:MAG: hypothetical protein K6T83_15455 [Alicyclobacillus sp.]|nr:hypothetical protein [Alicyclobacillus sp.]
MLDLKSILRTVLQQGMQDLGYPVVSVGYTASNTPNMPIITLKRGGAQDEQNRPLITLRRISGPRPVSYFLGNVAPLSETLSNTNPSPYANAILVEERIRIGIETAHDTGGQPLVDLLMMQIPYILLQNWMAMSAPVEVGGYGLISPSFQGGMDTADMQEVGGKVIYSNYVDFTARQMLETLPQPIPTTTIDYIEFEPILNNVDPNNPDFIPS